MDYEIENNFNWQNEINTEEELYDNSYCLISGLPLEDGFVTLPCNHSFNYINLYNEVINQKKRSSNMESNKLSFKQIKCPYCRNIYDNLLPYYNLKDIIKINGVNSPEHLTFNFHNCNSILDLLKKKRGKKY